MRQFGQLIFKIFKSYNTPNSILAGALPAYNAPQALSWNLGVLLLKYGKEKIEEKRKGKGRVKMGKKDRKKKGEKTKKGKRVETEGGPLLPPSSHLWLSH